MTSFLVHFLRKQFIAQHEAEDDVSKILKSDNSVLDWHDDKVKPTSECEPNELFLRSEVEFMHYLSDPDTIK